MTCRFRLALLFPLAMLAVSVLPPDHAALTAPRQAGPAPRHGVAAVYEASTRRVIVFGGVDRMPGYQDTWAWDGDAWHAVAREGPAPRWHFAMATDARRHEIVLFGGVDHTQKLARVFGDTWAWDGRSWRKVSDTGPSPRFAHAMAFDRGRGRIVMVGGRAENQQALNDTWSWDGQRWNRVEAGGLPARLLHGLAFDDTANALLVFGGWNAEEANYLGDTWRLEGTTWRRLDVAGPPALRAHIMVSDPRRHRIVLFGGYTSTTVSGDVWEWDGRGWARANIDQPRTQAVANSEGIAKPRRQPTS